MNLHATASAAVSAINPMAQVTQQQSGPYTTAADGTRTPTYTSTTFAAQVQPLSQRDLEHLDGLNIQGTMRSIHLTGIAAANVRVGQKGGDLFTFGGQVWLAVQVMEQWDTWCRVAVQLQTDAPAS